jgi:hypothetical protein
VKLKLAHFSKAGTAQVWRLDSGNRIRRLSDIAWSARALSDTAPAQSITLYVLPRS